MARRYPKRSPTQWLGRVGYEEALALQESLVARRAAGEICDQLLLLEHEPVYTIGRTPDQSSLRDVAALPHPVVRINRGGQATYHGPGQLVGYPILDLRARGQDLHRYLRALEEILIETCAHFGVAAQRRERLTGVWIGDAQDRVDRRRRAAMDQHARLCAEREWRPVALFANHAVRHRGRGNDEPRARIQRGDFRARGRRARGGNF